MPLGRGVMGCASSSMAPEQPASPAGKETAPPTRRAARGSMVQSATQPQRAKDPKDAERVAATDGSRAVLLPGARLGVKYAFLSQRGYYPGAGSGRARGGAAGAGCARARLVPGRRLPVSAFHSASGLA